MAAADVEPPSGAPTTGTAAPAVTFSADTPADIADTAATADTAASAVPDMLDMQTAVAGKKKKKSKSLAARGPTALPKNRGSGFEEYYAEPPLTVDEYEEESDLYHITLPFDERIETCIQRYRARRRLDNDRTNLFNRYLSVGGIDCMPRQFNGAMGMHDTEGLTASEKKTLGATDVVNQGGSETSKFYVSDNSHLWTVDFVGVVSGYLSVSLRDIGCSRERLMIVGIDLVDNFLRYLQLHDVCPEYSEDIQAARDICTKAHTELPNCRQVLSMMPGQFNRACAALFWHETDLYQFHDGRDPRAWAVEGEGDNDENATAKDDMDAEAVFRATVALQDKIVGPKALATANTSLSDIRIVSTEEMDLEITKLVAPSDALRQQYTDIDTKLQPAGIVICRHYCIEEGIANQPRPTQNELAARGKEAFLLDASAMALLTVGMKLRVVMHELSCDLNFVSAIKSVLPSFYTFLPQELMLDFKEPKDNEREAPSVDKPNADEEAMDDLSKEE